MGESAAGDVADHGGSAAVEPRRDVADEITGQVGDEVLLDDAIRVSRAHGAAGGDATLDIVGGCQHVFPIWCGVIPEADAAVERIAAWILDHTAGEP